MATRGQIAYLANPNTIYSIYVHYDAYPEALGKTLNTIFNSEEDAEMLVTDGHDIRTIEDDGTVDRFDKGGYKVIKGEDPEELFSNLYSHSDRAAADYVYVWLEDKWVALKIGKGRNYFIGTLLDQIRKIDQTMEEGNLGHNEIASLEQEGRFWIVTWSSMDGKQEKVFTDEDKARKFMNNLNKPTPEIPGFEGTQDALDNLFEEEYQKRKWQHRAGIIK